MATDFRFCSGSSSDDRRCKKPQHECHEHEHEHEHEHQQQHQQQHQDEQILDGLDDAWKQALQIAENASYEHDSFGEKLWRLPAATNSSRGGGGGATNRAPDCHRRNDLEQVGEDLDDSQWDEPSYRLDEDQLHSLPHRNLFSQSNTTTTTTMDSSNCSSRWHNSHNEEHGSKASLNTETTSRDMTDSSSSLQVHDLGYNQSGYSSSNVSRRRGDSSSSSFCSNHLPTANHERSLVALVGGSSGIGPMVQKVFVSPDGEVRHNRDQTAIPRPPLQRRREDDERSHISRRSYHTEPPLYVRPECHDDYERPPRRQRDPYPPAPPPRNYQHHDDLPCRIRYDDDASAGRYPNDLHHHHPRSHVVEERPRYHHSDDMSSRGEVSRDEYEDLSRRMRDFEDRYSPPAPAHSPHHHRDHNDIRHRSDRSRHSGSGFSLASSRHSLASKDSFHHDEQDYQITHHLQSHRGPGAHASYSSDPPQGYDPRYADHGDDRYSRHEGKSSKQGSKHEYDSGYGSNHHRSLLTSGANLKSAPPARNNKPCLPPAGESIYINIGPNQARLRRSKETVKAVARDFYVPTMCQVCSLDQFCIADAQYVICPTCQSVGPVEDSDGDVNGKQETREGAGLGFTFETLFQMQSEIASGQTTG